MSARGLVAALLGLLFGLAAPSGVLADTITITFEDGALQVAELEQPSSDIVTMSYGLSPRQRPDPLRRFLGRRPRRTSTITLTFDDGARQVIELEQPSADVGALSFAPTPQPTGDRFEPTNLARGKRTRQSSTAYGGDSPRAVDGNTNGDFRRNSVTHTEGRGSEWWEVDLGEPQRIWKIRLWNRTDCCGERLNRFLVLVSKTPFPADPQAAEDQPGVRSYFHEGVAGEQTEIPVRASGRYVRVQLVDPGPLSLAEVEVLGSDGDRERRGRR